MVCAPRAHKQVHARTNLGFQKQRGIIEKTYELDLSDFHDRLVADQLIKLANARFQVTILYVASARLGRRQSQPRLSSLLSPLMCSCCGNVALTNLDERDGTLALLGQRTLLAVT